MGISVIGYIRLKTYLSPLLRLFARRNKPWLASRAMLLVTRSLPAENIGGTSGPKRNRVLVLNANKDGVLEDLQAIFGSLGYELITWPSYALDAIADELLAPGLSHNCYVSIDPKVEASKIRYRYFLSSMWNYYKRIFPVDLVISANFGYYKQRELATALEDRGTPYIVLQKENFNGITPQRAAFWRAVYAEGRGQFTGRKILVYNEIERDLQISSGIVEAAKVVVTGMPRFDRIHRWRMANAGRRAVQARPRVLFFGFGRSDKIPTLINKQKRALSPSGASAILNNVQCQWSNVSWERLCAGTYEAIVKFSRSRPDVEVVVKTKSRAAQIDDTLEFLHTVGQPPDNLRVQIGGDPFELLIVSSVVVGFNTTGLIEAVAAGKPVIVPHFAEALDPLTQEVIIDLGDAVDYAHSPEHLVDLVTRHIDGGVGQVPLKLPPSRREMLRRLVGNDDGAASERVRQAVRHELEAK